jgi:glycine reductase
MELSGKKIIAIGERDGIPGPALVEVAKSAGAEVIYSYTQCFV